MKLAGLIAAVVLVLVPGALGGGISDEPCPNVGGENTNTCPSATVGEEYSVRFVEREGSGCGQGRQRFYLDSGLLPPGLSLTPEGTLSGVTFVAGAYRFYVEMREPEDDPAHCAGKRTQKQFTLAVRRQPWVVSVPALPPQSEVGSPFRMALRARGGSGVFTWRLSAGRFPQGLRLRPDGLIAGTPLRAGTYTVAAEATDTESRSQTWSATLEVSPRLRIGKRPLPRAQVGRSYVADLTAAAGALPRVWGVAHGRLPRGIRLAPHSGRLYGTPGETGTFRVVLKVRDQLKAATAQPFSLVVLPSSRPRNQQARLANSARPPLVAAPRR